MRWDRLAFDLGPWAGQAPSIGVSSLGLPASAEPPEEALIAGRFKRLRTTSALITAAAIVGSLGVSPVGAVHVPHPVVVSDDPAGFTPHVLSGRVNALLQIGTRLYAGGAFTQVQASGGGPVLVRNNLFAFDAATGAIDAGFVPNVNNEVDDLALAPDGGLLVSGRFTSINGTTRRRLAKLDPVNGQVITPFNPNPSSRVREIEVRGDVLYAAGSFETIGGQPRALLAALSPTTGAASSTFNLPVTDPRLAGTTPSVYHFDVSPDGTRMVVIGNFTRINGIPRWQIGMIDLVTIPASVRAWQTDRFTPTCNASFDTYMRAIDFSPNGDYFVVVSTGAYSAGTLCDTASRWESGATGSGLQPTWVDYTGGDTLTAVTITGTAVYVGGHQRWQNNPFRGDAPGPGAVPREGLAALDPVNGLPFSWDPGRARGVGVFDMYSTPTGLWVGSDTDRIGGETHRKIAFLPTSGGTVVGSTDPYALPGDLYDVPLSTGAQLTRRTFDGSSLGTSASVATPGFDLDPVRGMFALQGTLYYGHADGSLYARSFDGAAVGAAQRIDLRGLTNFPVPSVTGMFFTSGRIYFTVQGDPQLYYRYFTPESRIVGAERFSVPGAGDWSSARGITLAGGRIYFARTDGTLYRVDFTGGAPVPGTEAVVSPSSAGYHWASRGLFVFTHAAQGPVIFSDDFSSGTFSNWTGVTNLTVDPTMGGVAPPSVRANPSNQAAYAYRNLAVPVVGLTCASARVNATTPGSGSPVLMRLRTAGNGPVVRTWLRGGLLSLRADASGTQTSSGVALGSGWHLIELCGTVGTNTTWSLYRDGVAVVDSWEANTGTTPVGRVEIGDTAAKTFTINFDDVVIDQLVGS